MNTKHTPGPWKPYFDETYGVTGPDKGRVAICMNLRGLHGLVGRRSGEEVAANARLISAAPELLEVLQEVLVLIPDAYETKDRALRAIAKATGA